MANDKTMYEELEKFIKIEVSTYDNNEYIFKFLANDKQFHTMTINKSQNNVDALYSLFSIRFSTNLGLLCLRDTKQVILYPGDEPKYPISAYDNALFNKICCALGKVGYMTAYTEVKLSNDNTLRFYKVVNLKSNKIELSGYHWLMTTTVFKGTLLARYNYTSVDTRIAEPNAETLRVFVKDNALYINWYSGEIWILIAKSGKHNQSIPGLDDAYNKKFNEFIKDSDAIKKFEEKREVLLTFFNSSKITTWI